METLHSRKVDKWLLKANLKAALFLWKQFPDKLQHALQMENGINVGNDEGDEFHLRVNKNILENKNPQSWAISISDANEYGRVDGDWLIFDIPSSKFRAADEKKLSVRMGKVDGKNYLVLTGVSLAPIAWFSPDQISDFNVK